MSTIKQRIRQIPTEIRYQVRRLRYLMPNVLAPQIPLCSDMQQHLEELRRDGVTMIPDRYSAAVDYLNDTYVPHMDRQAGAHQVQQSSAPYIHHCVDRADAHRVEAHMSFKDPKLSALYFDADLCGLACNYYHRQAYYRNHPAIWKTYFDDHTTPFRTGKFHKDGGIHQLTFMLLLKDLTENDTHMQYAVGSHTEKTNVEEFTHRYRYADEAVEGKYKIVPCVGKKGAMFVFDAGNGFHRAVFKPGTERIHLHLIVTSGAMERADQLQPWDSYRDSLSDWSEFPRYPKHTRRMVGNLTVP